MHDKRQDTESAGGASVLRMLVRFMLMMLLLPAIMFIAAGTLNWLMAWLYTILTVSVVVGSRILVLRKNPDMLLERSRYDTAEGAKEWDKPLVLIVGFLGPLLSLVVAGLDKRFGWSPEIPLQCQFIALAVLALASLVSTWAFVVNKFFSATVRIQKDRGHTVVSDGPYRFVRHPGYASGIVANFAGPLALGSLWALIPGAVSTGIIIVRTALEDKTLHDELDGYQDYARRVRYRLVPGLW